MIAKDNTINMLTREVSMFTYHGIFFDGKMVCATKSRVYLQPGRAISEFISQNFYSLARGLDAEVDKTLGHRERREEQKKLVRQAIDELVKEGRFEIKAI